MGMEGESPTSPDRYSISSSWASILLAHVNYNQNPSSLFSHMM